MLRNIVVWLLALVALAGVLLLAALALGLALLAAPVLLLAGYLLLGKRGARPARPRRNEGRAVYEGEFRVLDERADRPR
jgi:hypothetical protein